MSEKHWVAMLSWRGDSLLQTFVYPIVVRWLSRLTRAGKHCVLEGFFNRGPLQVLYYCTTWTCVFIGHGILR